MIETEIICKCGNKGWVEVGGKTKPCHNCGRMYTSVYNKKTCSVNIKETFVALQDKEEI